MADKVFKSLTFGSGDRHFPLPIVTIDDAGKTLQVGSDGNWRAAEQEKELPLVSSLDSGKVLMVGADGTWQATSITNAEEVAY